MRDCLLKTFAGMACSSRKVFQAGFWGVAIATALSLFSPLVTNADAVSPLIHNSTYGGTGKYGEWGQDYTCATCHTKSATPNIKKVAASIKTPTGMRKVVMSRYTSMSRTVQGRYTAMSTDVVGVLGNDRRTIYQERSQNICEVCHHRTEYHQYSASKVAVKAGGLSHTAHKSNNRDCTGCHAHQNAFKRPAIESCDACHGNPPTTATTGAPSGLYTNVFGDPPTHSGAHSKHRNVLGFECQVCHNNYGHGLLGNDYVELGFRISSSNWKPFVGEVTTGTITVSNSAGLNTQFAVAPNNPGTTLLRAPDAMSCNIYCHGDNWNVPSGRAGTGVSWTQGPLGACSNAICHGTSALNPPTPVLLGNVSTGAHRTHVSKLNTACTTCHEDLPDPHMVNGRVNLNMTQANANLPAIATQARYNGFTLYSTHTLAASGSYFSCTNMYCHSNVQGTNGTGAPTSYQGAVKWGGNGSNAYLACDSCHGGLRANSTPINSGAHNKHIATSYYQYSCDSCHTGAGKNDQSKHANKKIEVTMAGSYSGSYTQTINVPGDGFGSCSNVSCHYGKSVGWGDGTLNCNACHGSDAATLSSGRHAGHISTAANSNLGTAFKCTACHAQVVTSNTTVSNYLRHANGFSDYSGRNAGRSYTAADGACANVYCHTDGKGRQNVPFNAGNGWNSGTVYYDCNGCHGNDIAPAFTSLGGEPNYTNATETQLRANSHSRHMGGVGVSTCIYCHASTVNSTGAILVNSTSHANRRIDVQAGAGKSFQYDPATRTCSNILCHGGYSTSVRWGKIFPADCTGCHGNNASSFRPLSTGKHTAHINHNVNIWGKNVRCNTCHALTAGLDDRSILDTSLHGNGFKNFTGVMAGGRGAYDIPSGVCSANYCHSDGKGKQNVPFTVANAWKSTATLSCTGCHGNDTSPDFSSAAGEPNYATGLPGSLRANDHKNHVDFGASTCISCHADTVNGTGVILANASTHVNKRIDVKAGNGKSFTYDAAFKSCTEISCHGGKGSLTQTWGTPVSADCTGCHGNNAGSSNPIASNKHTAHINNPALGGNFKCAECHGQTINPDDRTFANRQLHGNGLLNYSGARAGKSYDSAQGNCANTYCHTDGKGVQSTEFSLANGWKSAVTYTNCGGCHGSDASPAFTSTYGEPNYTNATEIGLRANSHQRHMGGLGSTTCVYCHNATVDATGALLTGTSHLNRSRDVLAGGGKSFGYDPPTRTCSNIICHGTGSAPAQWGKIFPVDCTGCHGNNALALKQISSGKHKAHTNNKTILGKNFSCNTCHALTAGADDRSILDTTVHGNGFKNVTGVMSGGRNTYTTATGVCSATYCHTDGKGKRNVPFTAVNAWKTTATLGCNGCHGNDTSPDFTSVSGEPNYLSAGAGALYANDHKNHVDFGAATCIDCHSETVDAAGALKQDVNSHLNLSIDVAYGNGKTFEYDKLTKTCSNIYCHGGKGSYSKVWGTPVSTTCTGCHGNNVASLQPISSGRHKAHINNAATLGTNYRCNACHALTINADDRTFANRQLHGNGLVNYSGSRAGNSYTFATGSCSNAYCHSDGKGRQNVPFSLANGWKSGTTYNGCKGCHGNDATLNHYSSFNGEPNYQNVAANVLRSNSHQKHVTLGAASCELCHSATVNASGAIFAGSTTHTNGRIEVKSGGTASFTGWTATAKNCSNINCHFNQSAVWGATLDCNSCHGGGAATLTTKKHSGHISTAANPSLGTAIRCAECHAKTVYNDNVTIRNSSVHINNVMGDYSGVKAGRYTVATGVCANLYCHTDGKGVQNVPFDASNGWNSSAVYSDCNGCHGNSSPADFTSSYGQPNYANAGANLLRSNSHRSHASAGASTCVSCHGTTTNASGAIFAGSSTHINRRIDVVQGGAATFGWNPATKGCNNISCHGPASTAVWGDPNSAGCTVCHGSNWASANPIQTGKHTAHMNNAAGLGSNYACDTCHAKSVSGDSSIIFVNTSTTHNNKFLNYSGPRAGRVYTAATGVCSNVYCHTDGKGRQNVAFSTANGWNSSVTYNGCKGCHGNDATLNHYSSYNGEPNYANAGQNLLRSNSHQKHVTAGAISCVLCHVDTVTSANIIVSSSTTHTNGTFNVRQGGTATFDWTAGKTCANISCHFNSSAVWGQTDFNCSSCHGGDAATLTSKKHSAHISTSLNPSLGTAIGCSECHAKTVNSDNATIKSTAIHFNGTMGDYSGARAGRYTIATGSCDNSYCHTDGKGKQNVPFNAGNGWNSAAVFTDCKGCHGNDTAAAFTSAAGEPNYANTGLPGSVTSNSHNSHVTALGDAASCDYCHFSTVTVDGLAAKAGGNHLNGTINVDFDRSKEATAGWDGSSRTCSTIACHSGGAAKWGDASSVGCKVCHGTLLSKPGVHQTHVGNLLDSITFYGYTAIKSSGGVYRIGCANCHPTIEAGNHKNGKVDLSINKDKSGAGYVNRLNNATADGLNNAGSGIVGTSKSSITCSMVYCHSSGKSTVQQDNIFKTTPNWYSAAGSVANRCGMCHDNPPQYAGQSHYVAQSSMGNNGTGTPRDSGHMIGIHFKNTYKGPGQQGFLGYSSEGNMAHGNNGIATTMACYICHSGVVSSSKIDTFAMYSTGSKFECRKCHTASTRTPLQTGEIAETALHVNGRKDVVFPANTMTFKTKAQLSNVANSGGYWTRVGGYKETSDSYDSTDLSTSAWNPDTKNCATACHVNQPNINWGTNLKCSSCHANQ
jgi:predicted CxxxxCH...CXXCH cytochrome family protein